VLALHALGLAAVVHPAAPGARPALAAALGPGPEPLALVAAGQPAS
jgi:hypothetical protein